MADRPDRDSRTEEATEKRIRDEIERGNVPVSREASIFAFAAGLMIILGFFLKDGAMGAAFILARLIDHADGFRLSTGSDAVALFGIISMGTGALIVPIFTVLVISGLGASLAQNAPRIVFERIRPDVSDFALRRLA